MTDLEISSLKRLGNAPYFVLCDHASNAIPPEMNSLGMPDDILQTHIAWDIGAGALASALAKQLSGTLFQCAFSRLIVDPNRAVTAKDSIPSVSDLIPIPGNQMLNAAARTQRIEKFFDPYHTQFKAALDDMVTRTGGPFAISVHSFTNRLMGTADDRPWHIGLLWREDESNAAAMIDYLNRETGWLIGDNQPYDARQFNYSVDRHVAPRGLPHLTFEVRQDLLSDDRRIAQLAETLARGIIKIAPQRHAAAQSKLAGLKLAGIKRERT